MSQSSNLKTLSEIGTDLLIQPPKGRDVLIVEEVESFSPEERIYVVRVRGGFTRGQVGQAFHAGLQNYPGLSCERDENAEAATRLGSPCRECDCGGQVARIEVAGE
jgi:hypothetical protein